MKGLHIVNPNLKGENCEYRTKTIMLMMMMMMTKLKVTMVIIGNIIILMINDLKDDVDVEDEDG